MKGSNTASLSPEWYVRELTTKNNQNRRAFLDEWFKDFGPVEIQQFLVSLALFENAHYESMTDPRAQAHYVKHESRLVLFSEIYSSRVDPEEIFSVQIDQLRSYLNDKLRFNVEACLDTQGSNCPSI